MRPTPSRSFATRSCSRRSHAVSQTARKAQKEAQVMPTKVETKPVAIAA
ncbi:MAG: hypothetical protein ACPHV3_03605 [Vibrio sp.]